MRRNSGLQVLSMALALLALSCREEPSKRLQQQLEELQKKQQTEKAARELAEQQRLAPKSAPPVALAPPYDDSNTRIVVDGPCPDGLGALFPGAPVPGATAEEKKANEGKRAALAEALRSRQYMVRLSGAHAMLKPFDAPAGRFDIHLSGTVDCSDSVGRVAIAWTDAKAGDPGNSAAKQGAEVTQNVWLAPPVVLHLPMASQVEAKEFFQANRVGLTARVVFKLGNVEVDKKLKKIAKVSETVELAGGAQLGYGGGTEDWGAGRLVRAELVGIRLATEQDRKQLLDERGTK